MKLMLHSTAERLGQAPEEGREEGPRWRKQWGPSPVRKGKRNCRLCPSLQELITQKDQLFPIISEDRTRGNRPQGLRFKFRYSEGFPSSVEHRPAPGKGVWVKPPADSHLRKAGALELA